MHWWNDGGYILIEFETNKKIYKQLDLLHMYSSSSRQKHCLKLHQSSISTHTRIETNTSSDALLIWGANLCAGEYNIQGSPISNTGNVFSFALRHPVNYGIAQNKTNLKKNVSK